MAAKLFLLFSIPFLLIKPTLSLSISPSLPLLISIFPISRVLHRSLFLHSPFLIIVLSHHYFLPLSFSLDTGFNSCVVQCWCQRMELAAPTLPWSYMTSHWGHGTGDTHAHAQTDTELITSRNTCLRVTGIEYWVM